MTASLPMYDWPEIRRATDAWWAGLARHLRHEKFPDVPSALMRGAGEGAPLADPALLFSQTCGWPLVHLYPGKLKVIASPCYAVAGCSGPTYRSRILVRADAPVFRLAELAGKRAAYNSAHSLSGHAALRLVFAPVAQGGRFFCGGVETGSHAGSMAAVAERRAEVCAIDCVSYAIAARYRPSLTASLRELAVSPELPALPYVTGRRRSDAELARLRAALFAALADPALAAAREAIFLAGAEVLPDNAYDRIRALESEAASFEIPASGASAA